MCFTIYKLFVLQIIIKPLGFLKHYGFSKERTQQKLLKSSFSDVNFEYRILENQQDEWGIHLCSL